MGISEYLLSRPRATAFTLLLPLLAALLTYLLLQRQAPRYVGEARVIVPTEAATSASGVGLYIADFTVLLKSEETVQAVTEATRQDGDDVREGLEVSREGQSSLFTVTYTTEDRSVSEPVLRTAITTTMAGMAPTTDAEQRLERARLAHAQAQNQLRTLQDSIGLLFPDREYNLLSFRIRSLQGQPDPASRALRARLIARRAALVEPVRTYDELNNAVDAAATELRDAERAAADSAGAAADIREGRAIQWITIAPAPSRHLVQAVGAGAVLGLVGGIGLLVGPDLLRGTRRPSGLRETDPAEPVAWPTEPTPLPDRHDPRHSRSG